MKDGNKRRKQEAIKAQYARMFFSCAGCGKPRIVYCSQGLTPAQIEQYEAATTDRNAYCGCNPLPDGHPLREEGPLQVKHRLTCMKPVEQNYYSDKIPRSGSFPPGPWPLVCFHCGSNQDVQRDEQMQQVYQNVMPQCAGCRQKKTAIVTSGKKKQNKKAPDARRKNAEAEERVVQARAAGRQPVPAREEEHVISKIVGKKKATKEKFVLWEREDGTPCPKDWCTWEKPAAFENNVANSALDPDELIGNAVLLSVNSTQYEGIIEEHRAGTNQYKITFKTKGRGRAKAAGFFDLELPTRSTDKVSWWHLAGYEEYVDPDSAEDDDGTDNVACDSEERDEEEEGDDMDEDEQ